MVHHFAFNFAPVGFGTASGQLLSIAQNTALFSILGTTFGGNGQTTFALPNYGDRLSAASGQGAGLSFHSLGEIYGNDTISLKVADMPSPLGGVGEQIQNVQPTLGMTYMISPWGSSPAGSNGGASIVGSIWEFGGNFVPRDWLACDGGLVSISTYPDLFALIGTTYGGDGVTTFAVPNLLGRTPIGASAGSGPVGTVFGAEASVVLGANLPANMGGTGTAIDNREPGLVINYIIAIEGIFPSRNAPLIDLDPLAAAFNTAVYLGEIIAYAGTALPAGYAFAQGQLLSIAQNTALFSLLGTTYGGNGTTTFALPDLRGRAMVGASSSARSAPSPGRIAIC